MTAEELYNITLDLLTDSNEESYPFDFFVREANAMLKLLHPRVLNWDRDKNEYVQAVNIELVPSALTTPGMEGYKGRYSLPEDLHTLIRVEISKDGKCDFKKATRKDLNELAGCDESENYDECCNKNSVCCGECECFQIENNMIIITSYPTKRGLMKIWYLRKPKPIKNKNDEVDFVKDFEELIALKCALRYARRHTGQYAKRWWDETKEEEEKTAIELQRFLKNRYGEDATTTTVPLTI